jgi:hypothetical protein
MQVTLIREKEIDQEQMDAVAARLLEPAPERLVPPEASIYLDLSGPASKLIVARFAAPITIPDPPQVYGNTMIANVISFAQCLPARAHILTESDR